MTTRPSDIVADVLMFGNRFLTQEVASQEFPETGMPALDALRLVSEDLALEGDPARNLATFVTRWMEPQAQRIIAENLHRNFIDHAEYPRTAEIEQRCLLDHVEVRALSQPCDTPQSDAAHADANAQPGHDQALLR